MKGNNVLGIIFANSKDESLRELTGIRAFGSIPFGGKYRLIDFVLSNMVNSKIRKIGIVTKRNYQSLMDHLGSGKYWNLSKQRGGLSILPPFSEGNGNFDNKVKMLYEIKGFLERSKEEYVLISDCDVISNINYDEIIRNHIENEADITLIYKKALLPKKLVNPMVPLVNEDDRVIDIIIGTDYNSSCNFLLDMYLINKNLLIKLITDCINSNRFDFRDDIIYSSVNKYNVFGYELIGESYIICSVDTYFDANMALMSRDVRNKIFDKNRPIYTKVKDDMPARYGGEAIINNSLISNGCKINGCVENSILFRGAEIKKGAKVSNCILMDNDIIESNSDLSYVIADKDIKFGENKSIKGLESFPIYINKSTVI